MAGCPRTEISMLEVVERMQVLNWNMGARWSSTFVGGCKKTFLVSVNDFIDYWRTWYIASIKDFVENILFFFNENNLKFLLKEQEA